MLEKEKEDLIKENEELKNKLSKILSEEKEEKQNKLKSIVLCSNEGFTFEKKDDKDNNKHIYSLENIQFSIDKLQKPLLNEQEIEIKKEENKPDSDKKEIKIITKTILKRTKIVKNEFKNNSICVETQFNINNQSLKEKEKEKCNDYIINKIISFTINKTEEKKEEEKLVKNNFDLLEIKKNEDIIIRNYKNKKLGNDIINRVNSIMLLNVKLQKPKKKITEYSFGDITQLSNDQLQKQSGELTDKKTEMDKSASYNINILKEGDLDTQDKKDKQNDNEDELKLYKKRTILSSSTITNKNLNKKKKLKTLVIDLDNKFELKKSFDIWSEATPNLLIKNKDKKPENLNDTDKNKSLNIKQVIKGKTKNLKLQIDKPNLEKEEEDKDKKTIEVDTSKDDSSSNSVNSRDDKSSRRTKHIKIKRIKKDANKQNIDKKLSESIKDKLKEEDNKNENTPRTDNDEEKDKDKYKDNRPSIGSKNNFSESSIEYEVKDRLSIDKKDQDIVKPAEPPKREIIIKRKICIISKKAKKKKADEVIKQKFFEKRFLIKFWKKWKKDIGLEKEEEKIEKEDEKKEEKQKENEGEKKEAENIPISVKKPLILKINRVSIKKQVLEIPKTKIIRQKKVVEKEKIILLRKVINKINEMKIKRHFFYKWKEEMQTRISLIIGANPIQKMARKYFIKCLIKQGKIMKFRTLLIKYAFNRHK